MVSGPQAFAEHENDLCPAYLHTFQVYQWTVFEVGQVKIESQSTSPSHRLSDIPVAIHLSGHSDIEKI